MVRPSDPIRRIESTLLVTALALLLFATPVIYWWAQDDSPWYLVYVLWLAIIGITAWLQLRGDSHDL
jgi:hypothetical protein